MGRLEVFDRAGLFVGMAVVVGIVDVLAAGMQDGQWLALHEALEGLAAHDALKAELVKLRFFAGLTIEEAASVLDLSEPTAKRYWAYARAWLYREINSTA